MRDLWFLPGFMKPIAAGGLRAGGVLFFFGGKDKSRGSGMGTAPAVKLLAAIGILAPPAGAIHVAAVIGRSQRSLAGLSGHWQPPRYSNTN